MRKSEKFLWQAAFLCMGMAIGFLLAPIKAGISCGNSRTIYAEPKRGTEDDGEDA